MALPAGPEARPTRTGRSFWKYSTTVCPSPPPSRTPNRTDVRHAGGFAPHTGSRSAAQSIGLRLVSAWNFALHIERAGLHAGWGRVDRADRICLAGWARDPFTPDRRALLDLVCNDQPIGQVLVNRFRPDLLRIGPGDGRLATPLDGHRQSSDPVGRGVSLLLK